ncbi:MAG TPA: hypothetical protein VEB59_00905 [Gemmatimonadales bacterium]|nr:hypothetical protein [Gemmatimonadales bacterium]
MRRLLLTLAAGALTGGCDPAPETVAPSFVSAQRPDAAGRVVRFRAGFFAFLNFDPETNLQSVIGLPSDPADTPAPFCAGGDDFEVLDWQTVAHESGPVSTLIRAGEVNVHVYESAAFGALFESGDLCGAISLPRRAEGRARLQYTDNDFDVSGSRANSFGWRVHGIVDDLAAGTRARYLDRLHGVLRPTGAFDFTVTQVRLW